MQPQQPSHSDCQALVGRLVRKHFPPDEGFEGGWFGGKVKSFDKVVIDEQGTTWPGPFFSVDYEDGDSEHLPLDELNAILVPDENGAGPSYAAKGKSKRGSKALAQLHPNNASGATTGKPPSKKARLSGAARTAPAADVPMLSANDDQRAGQLYKLRLENFMCHEQFEMVFGTNINFISGTNGSGKSAVLQGIQACLGVKASETGRSSSLNTFIKEGAGYALIAVTIYNTGDDAYERELYGDFITVERRLGPQNSFTLKNAQGRKVASGRSALTTMLDSLNLNASNPVAVLTQDTARTFLAGAASDKRKYDLFMEATLLEHISETQQTAENRVQEIKGYLTSKKTTLKEQRKATEELRTKVNDLQQVSDKKAYSEHLGSAVAWQRVYAFDGPLADLDHKLDVVGPKKLDEIEEQMMKAEAEANVLAEDLQSRKAAVVAMGDEITAATRQASKLQALQREAKKSHMEAVKRVANKKQELAEAKERQANILDTALEDHEELVATTQHAIAEHERGMGEMERQEKQIAVEAHEIESTIRELRAENQQAATTAENVKDREDSVKQELYSLDAELKTLRASKSNAVDRFVPNGHDLMQRINQNKSKFHRLPVGPIGMHLSISDEKWGVAVEKALGGHFQKFIVHDGHDAELIRRLARDCRIHNFSCVIRQFDIPPHQIPQAQMMPAGVTSLMDLVQCNSKDPAMQTIINNCMIDMGSVERIAVANTDEEGKRLAYGGDRRIIRVFGRDGAQFFKKGSSEWAVSAGAQKIFPRLGADVASQVAVMEAAKAEHEERLRAIREEHKLADRHVNEIGQRIKSAFRRKKEISTKQMRLATEKNQFLSQKPLEVEIQDPQSVMEAELRDVQDQIRDLELEMAELENKEQKANQLEAEAMEEFKAKKQESDSLKSKNVEQTDRLTGLNTAVSDARDVADKARAKKAAVVKKLKALEDSRARIQQDRRQAEEEAKAQCTEEDGHKSVEYVQNIIREKLGGEGAPEEAVEEASTPDRLERDLLRVLKEIEAQEKNAGGTLEQLEATLHKDDKRLRKDTARYEEVLQLLMLFQESVALRRSSLKRLDKNTEANVQNRFKHYMSLKGNVGTIRLNRAEGKLVMSVTMNNAKNERGSGPVEDLKSLSGGERSFTTVSFILALGEITDNPFRAMDEFDVFMDAVNRRISMQSLIKFAHDQKHVQFMFLTPQDIAAVDDAKKACEKQYNIAIPDEFIKVVCMQPARENAARS